MELGFRHWFAAIILAVSAHLMILGSLDRFESDASDSSARKGVEISLQALSLPQAVKPAPEPPKVVPEPPAKQPKPEVVKKPVTPVKKPPAKKAIKEAPSTAAPAQPTPRPPVEQVQVVSEPTLAPSNPASPRAAAALEASENAARYEQLIAAWLARHKQYPRRARLRGQTGTVTVKFVLGRDGQVLETRIKKSAGYRLLDREALALFERATPLPPMPASMPGSTFVGEVPVEFDLSY